MSRSLWKSAGVQSSPNGSYSEECAAFLSTLAMHDKETRGDADHQHDRSQKNDIRVAQAKRNYALVFKSKQMDLQQAEF